VGLVFDLDYGNSREQYTPSVNAIVIPEEALQIVADIFYLKKPPYSYWGTTFYDEVEVKQTLIELQERKTDVASGQYALVEKMWTLHNHGRIQKELKRNLAFYKILAVAFIERLMVWLSQSDMHGGGVTIRGI